MNFIEIGCRIYKVCKLRKAVSCRQKRKVPIAFMREHNGDFPVLTVRIRLYCMLLGICSNVVFTHMATTQPILSGKDRGEKDGETGQATQATGKSLWAIIAAVHYKWVDIVGR